MKKNKMNFTETKKEFFKEFKELLKKHEVELSVDFIEINEENYDFHLDYKQGGVRQHSLTTPDNLLINSETEFE